MQNGRLRFLLTLFLLVFPVIILGDARMIPSVNSDSRYVDPAWSPSASSEDSAQNSAGLLPAAVIIDDNTARDVMSESSDAVEARAISAPAGKGETQPEFLDVPGSVLIINSYHIGYEWSDDIMDGIRAVFARDMPSVNLYFEYLDSKRFLWTPKRGDNWAREIGNRYKGLVFDAIIVSDDIAYQFILKNHAELFPGVPVLFCGVNYFDPAEIAEDPLVSGVVQTVDLAASVDLMRQILPGLKRVYAVVDNSLTGEAYRKTVENYKTTLEDVDIEFLDGHDLSFDELLAQLSRLEDNSAVLMMLFLEDRNGDYFPQPISYPKIAGASRVPVFQVTESGLGYGLGGGVIQTGRSQGRRVAMMAVEAIRGTPVKQIPVELHGNGEQRVDWDALQRYWGLSRRDFLLRSQLSTSRRQLPARPTRLEYRICLSNEPVISRYNSIGGWFSGLAVELLEILSRRAGWRFDYVYVEDSGMLTALKRGQCDLAMPSSLDETTLAKLDLTEQPLFSNWGAVYVREGTPFSGMRDLQGKTVGLVTDSAFAVPFIRQAQHLGLDTGLVWADSYNEVLGMVVDGSVDAAVVSRLHPISSRFAYRITPTDILVYPTGQRLAALKGRNREFIEAFDAYMPGLKSDPSSGYQDVTARYTFKQKVPWVPGWIWAVLGAFGIAVVFVVMLRGEVFRKTRELREREDNLTVILDSIGDAVIATDASLMITRINPVACKLTGWSEFEAQGRPLARVFNIVDAVTRESLSGWVDSVLSRGVGVSGADVRPILLSRSGAEVRVDESASPMRDRDGKVIGTVVVFSDVTESIAREERRRQSQKMEAIGQLAGGIAHDFNNILGGVVGIAEFLASRYREDPVILKYCGHIVQSGHRASQMTRRLLDFARLGKAESVPLSVNAVTASAVEILKGTLARNIDIGVFLNAVPDIIVGDASQIENMLLNMGINARDAMPDGGSLQISTENVELSGGREVGRTYLPAGSYIKLSVSDNGVGINPDAREKIFEPFFTTKEIGRGTGLGLAAVLGIVEEHQGAIDVESGVSKGTVFTVYFPLSVNAEMTEPELQTDEIRNYRGVVLVIDDEPIIRTMAEVLLSESGFDVITAASGAEGLDIFRERGSNIDVVLLDFIMPGMDGLATLRELKSIDPDVRVVIASGFTSEHRRQNFIDAGAVDAVSKPFSQQEICDVLARAASSVQ